MKPLLAAVTAAAALAAVGSASAQPIYGHGYSYGQDYSRSSDGWRGSAYPQSSWGRRDLTGYTARHGAYNRGGDPRRDRDDWRRSPSFGPMGAQVYPYGAGYAAPFQGVPLAHW